MTAVRVVLAALGLAAVVHGVLALVDLGTDNLLAAATWLVAGVLVHDAVLAPLTVAAALVLARGARRGIPGPVVVGALVLGSVTLVAVPVLGRFGARADNPTLLDQNYVLGWLVLATLTLTGVGVSVALSRPGRGGDRGQGARGR